MDFSIPLDLSEEVAHFNTFLEEKLVPELSTWYQSGAVPRRFFSAMGGGGWLGFSFQEARLSKLPALRAALLGEQLAMLSPGVAVAILAHVDLGLTGLWLFGSDMIKERYGKAAVRGETLLCLGNTEGAAGSDVANVSMRAEKVDGGWVLNGTKAYVTNGFIGDMSIMTAVSHPKAARSNRLSMFLVDLSAKGVTKNKLNKQVWIPSDLTRVQLTDVFVSDDHLLGDPGRGLQQVLTIFTYSRVPISALTLGTAAGAFRMAVDHSKKRKIFNQKIADHQAKAFEIADHYAKIEAARLTLLRTCWAMDEGRDFRLESSLAKYLTVTVAREVTQWAADLFGAASVIHEHPIHKFPMDAWASSLGEGTQDIQKLDIFREVMKMSL